MILLSGADLVLPDRVLGGGTLVLDGDRIAEIVAGRATAPAQDVHFSFPDHYIVPGFIDVHVHGIEGIDALDGGTAITTMAERLPRYGVTAFCPTSLACDPPSLRRMLAGVRVARTTRPPGGARVLPAHLESNFINPEFKGAQPLDVPARSPGVRPGSDRGQTGAGRRSRPGRVRALDRRRHPERDRRGAARCRHHHARAGDRRRDRFDPRRSSRTGTTSRSAIPARPTSRRRRGSAPARGRRRTSSTR